MNTDPKQSWYRFGRAVWRRLNGLPEASIRRPKGGRPRGDGPTNQTAEIDDDLVLGDTI